MQLGIIMFVASVLLNVAGLLTDLVLILHECRTITSWSQEHRWLMVVIMLVQFVGCVGLAIHLAWEE